MAQKSLSTKIDRTTYKLIQDIRDNILYHNYPKLSTQDFIELGLTTALTTEGRVSLENLTENGLWKVPLVLVDGTTLSTGKDKSLKISEESGLVIDQNINNLFMTSVNNYAYYQNGIYPFDWRTVRDGIIAGAIISLAIDSNIRDKELVAKPDNVNYSGVYYSIVFHVDGKVKVIGFDWWLEDTDFSIIHSFNLQTETETLLSDLALCYDQLHLLEKADLDIDIGDD